MKNIVAALIVAVAIVIASFSVGHAQVGIGGNTAPAFSTSVAGCPTITTGYFLCIVVPGGTTQPSLALSVAGWNSGKPFAIGGGTAVGVLTFKGRAPDASGNITPIAGDYGCAQVTNCVQNPVVTVNAKPGPNVVLNATTTVQ